MKIVAFGLAVPVWTTYMDCNGAPLCGVLVIESGLASSGTYHQALPGTHGLWPETGGYGTSQCIAPSGSKGNPTTIYDCYKNDGGGLVDFETHEWTKHGECAGVKDAKDFFTQVCAMSKEPITIMTNIKQSGGDLKKMESALSSAGYSVFSLDTTNQQVYLSACAGLDGQWRLAPQSQFGALCKGGSPSPSPHPSPHPSPSPSPGGCPKTCSGYTCDEWYDYNGNTCAYEESNYGCDCGGCQCKGGLDAIETAVV